MCNDLYFAKKISHGEFGRRGIRSLQFRRESFLKKCNNFTDMMPEMKSPMKSLMFLTRQRGEFKSGVSLLQEPINGRQMLLDAKENMLK